MKIIDYYYNDNNRMLYVEFSTVEDGDKFYRQLELNYSDVEYYSPNLITEDDLHGDLQDNFLVEIIVEYLKENDIPDEISL